MRLHKAFLTSSSMEIPSIKEYEIEVIRCTDIYVCVQGVLNMVMLIIWIIESIVLV